MVIDTRFETVSGENERKSNDKVKKRLIQIKRLKSKEKKNIGLKVI